MFRKNLVLQLISNIEIIALFFILIFFGQKLYQLKNKISTNREEIINLLGKKYTNSVLSQQIKNLLFLHDNLSWSQKQNEGSLFVSIPYLIKNQKLIDPMESSESLYPPITNKWLVQHHIDYTDPMILDKDIGNKGFTLREEYEAGTDPKNINEKPPLCIKLFFLPSDLKKQTSIVEFLGQETLHGENFFKIRYTDNFSKNIVHAPNLHFLKMGEVLPHLPLKVIDFFPDDTNSFKHESTHLTLQNIFLPDQIYIIPQKSKKSDGTSIESLAEISLHYSIPGRAEKIFIISPHSSVELEYLNQKEKYTILQMTQDSIILRNSHQKYQLMIGNNFPHLKMIN